MANCLVTGGAGFIGAHLTNELIRTGNTVIVIDDLSGGFAGNIHKEALFIVGSVTDYQLLAKVFNENKIDYVYHFAAYAAEGLSHFIKRYNYTNNLIGSVNLINESVKHKVKCFVFASSIAVYGHCLPPVHEETVPLPEDPYGIAKLAVEQELRVTKDMFGLDYIIFRPHNVYGEYQNIGDKYRNVIGIFMNLLLQGKPLTVFGDGLQTRAFSYVDDIVPIIAKSAFSRNAYNQVFNIGADEVYTVCELANRVMEEMNITSEIRYLPHRNEVMHTFSDHSKVYNYFGRPDNTSLKTGIGKMAAWVRKAGVRTTKNFSDIEIFEKLPSLWLE